MLSGTVIFGVVVGVLYMIWCNLPNMGAGYMKGQMETAWGIKNTGGFTPIVKLASSSKTRGKLSVAIRGTPPVAAVGGAPAVAATGLHHADC